VPSPYCAIPPIATAISASPAATVRPAPNLASNLGASVAPTEGVHANRAATDPWQKQLRAMVEVLIRVMRDHPSLPDLFHVVDKSKATSFSRATNDALALIAQGGFTVEESFWIASYLLHGAIGLVAAQPDCPQVVPPAQVAEWRRQRRLQLEALPANEFPMLIAFADTYNREPDPERYFGFGVDLLMAALETAAQGRITS
jgi:tetracycline repressor-like protein